VTTWGNADILVEMLDRQLEFLVGQQEERRVMCLSRWLGFLFREPQLAGLAAELSEEAREALRDFTQRDHSIRLHLENVWREHGKLLREHLAGVFENDQLHAYVHMDAFEEAVQARPRLVFPRWGVFDEDRLQTEDLAHALHHWAKWAIQICQEGPEAIPDALVEVRDRAKDAELAFQFLKRQLRTASEALAGPALHRLRAVFREANPKPPTIGDAKSEDLDDLGWRQALFEMSNEFASKVHSMRSLELRQLGSDDVTAAAGSIAEDAELVTHELQVRLLAGRSRIALVRRYAARCEGFDAADLRRLAQEHEGQVERQLTLNFARYLFEQGLTPLMDATTGGLRPDVIDASPGALLYVEAKQYGDGAPRQRIIGAYRQVWSTWGRLANAHRVREAFLLVFRVAGPRAELPEVIVHAGRRLYSVLVDISEDAGSREKHNPLSFEISELIPAPAGSAPDVAS
jgi:hypothetical protein